MPEKTTQMERQVSLSWLLIVVAQLVENSAA